MGRTAALPSRDALFGGPKLAKQDTQKLDETHPGTVVVKEEPTSSRALGREKYTTRLDTETLLQIERVKTELRQRTGKKIRTCWMIEAALRHVFLVMEPEQALNILKAEIHRLEK